jgi:hypothetical protein
MANSQEVLVTAPLVRGGNGNLSESKFLMQILAGQGQVGGFAEVPPVGVVVAEGYDFFALGGEAEIGIDDGEGAGFGE